MKPAWWSPWTWRRHGQTPWFLVLWGSSHLEDPARKGPTGFGKLSAFRGRLDPGWGLDAAFNGEFCKSGGKHREIKVDLRCKKKTKKCQGNAWFHHGEIGWSWVFDCSLPGFGWNQHPAAVWTMTMVNSKKISGLVAGKAKGTMGFMVVSHPCKTGERENSVTPQFMGKWYQVVYWDMTWYDEANTQPIYGHNMGMYWE